MASLAAVDAMVLFNKDTQLDLICSIKSNVLAKGGDYTIDRVVGRDRGRGLRSDRIDSGWFFDD